MLATAEFVAFVVPGSAPMASDYTRLVILLFACAHTHMS